MSESGTGLTLLFAGCCVLFRCVLPRLILPPFVLSPPVMTVCPARMIQLVPRFVLSFRLSFVPTIFHGSCFYFVTSIATLCRFFDLFSFSDCWFPVSAPFLCLVTVSLVGFFLHLINIIELDQPCLCCQQVPMSWYEFFLAQYRTFFLSVKKINKKQSFIVI